MNRRSYNVILLFTGFTLVGIMLLQGLWMWNMINVYKRELKADTQEALSSAVQKISRHENITMVLSNMHDFIPDSLVQKHQLNLESLHDSLRFEVRQNVSQVTINSSDTISDERTIIRHHNDGIHHDQKVVIETRTSDRVKDIDSLVHHMLIEFGMKSVTDRINMDSLKNSIKEELEKRGINLEFELGVLNDDSLMLSTENYDASTTTIYSELLFPDDIIEKNYHVELYYTNSSMGYLFSRMKTLLGLSLLFTLGILIAFYLTIRTLRKQKKLSEMKNDFINNMTHEFKTPIATSAIAISALQDEKVKGDKSMVDHYTNILEEENTKMNAHVEKVLNIAMMDKGTIQLNNMELNAHEILHNCIKGFHLMAEEKKAVIQISNEAEHSIVSADKFHLTNSFNNIIDNALKYSDDGCSLHISTSNELGHLIIKFKDNGHGMDEGMLKRAFDKFYRGQSGLIHDVKGFGLGLSYTKSIIEKSGGKVDIDSSKGKGTTVIIELPIIKK